MPYLLDSDVLIDISRNRPAAIDYVDTLPAPWMISQVTPIEILFGARDKRVCWFSVKWRAGVPRKRVYLPQSRRHTASEPVGKRRATGRDRALES